jgi:hypothetical protein
MYDSFFFKSKYCCWVLWLMPVTLATWEAEIRKIVVSGQPRQIVRETPILKKKKRERERLHLQNYQSKMAWRCGTSSKAPALQSPEFRPQ